MTLSEMAQHNFDLGTHVRADGQAFEVSAVLFESPPRFDFWQVPIDAHHKDWGHMRFVLTIPKSVAPDVHLAAVVVRGRAFEQVKAALQTATLRGRALSPTFSVDGWVLI